MFRCTASMRRQFSITARVRMIAAAMSASARWIRSRTQYAFSSVAISWNSGRVANPYTSPVSSETM